MRARATVWAALLAAVVTVVPASADGESRALALQAAADHDASYAVRTYDHTTVYFSRGGEAEVTMPPQVEPVETGFKAGNISLVGRYSGRRGSVFNRAEGNLQDGVAAAHSRTEQLYLDLDGVVITADTLRSNSTTTCDGEQTAAASSAGSAVAGLRVDGEPIPVADEPNGVRHRVDLPEGRGFVDIAPLVVETTESGDGWTTTALRITVHTNTPNPPPISPDELLVTHELAYGVATTSIDCA